MKKKRYIVLLTIMVIFLILMYIFVGRDYIKQGKEETTLIVGNNNVWSYSSGKWVNSSKLNELYWQNFVLYDDNEKIGTFQVWKDNDKWHYFDKEKTEQKVTGKTLAYKTNRSIKVNKYEEEPLLENDNNINYVLKDNDIDLNSELSSRYKINIDYDHDNVDEKFYIISNIFLESDSKKIFSIAFMVDNEKLYYLYKSISTNTDFYNGCKPYYNYFVDVMDDSTDEIILSCSEYSNSKTNDMLFQYQKEDNKFKILVSN